MRLSDVQTLLAERLKAAPGIVALHAEPALYSALADDQPVKDAITAQLLATGVFIEIGMPELGQLDHTGSGGLFSAAIVPVFVAESPAKAHEPSWLALVDAVIEAICEGGGDPAAVRIIAANAPVQEGGYVLHEITVSVRLLHG